VSNGGVHSHINHIKAITSLCAAKNFHHVLIHAFTDGRDTDPKSGYEFLKELEEHLEKTTGKIATVTGRYYAMDRDKRWERVKIAYDVLINAVGEKTNNILAAVESSYTKNVTDEFIMPLINNNAGDTKIKAGVQRNYRSTYTAWYARVWHAYFKLALYHHYKLRPYIQKCICNVR
jgi:2,3-bisphosphoglycerate-independent phosphoglycerate mutase